MLTSKERSELRSQANGIETTLIVGKDGVSENVIAEAENLLTARELIKGKVLENSLLSAREGAEELAQATRSQVVQVIGTKFVLFRFQPDLSKRKIELVKDTKKKKAAKEIPEVIGEAVDDGYDGYYNDVLPPDTDRVKDGLDKELVKKIVALCIGVTVVILMCVALLYIL